jgi:hypothetical protein
MWHSFQIFFIPDRKFLLNLGPTRMQSCAFCLTSLNALDELALFLRLHSLHLPHIPQYNTPQNIMRTAVLKGSIGLNIFTRACQFYKMNFIGNKPFVRHLTELNIL